MEQLLHYTWKHKLYGLHALKTTEGKTVEIIDPGLANMHAGPDFFNAKIKIDDVLWVGNVEIHEHSSDWFRHGHHTDCDYDSVILHVASDIDATVQRSNGEVIPQMELHYPEQLLKNYEELLHEDRYPACFRIIPQLSKFTVHSWMTALQIERFENKAKSIEKRLADSNQDWEQAFFITLARNFGFGVNSDAFELWAKNVPLSAVNKHRDDLFQIEAFFFVGRSRGIRAKYSFIVTKADRYRSPPKTKFAVKSLEQSADLSFVDGSFIIKKFTDGWINIHAVTPLKIINWKKYMPSFMAFDLKTPTDRSRSDCVHEQVAKRTFQVRFADR